MRKVDSYDQLQKEKKRLLEKQIYLETVLKKDLNELKEEIDKKIKEVFDSIGSEQRDKLYQIFNRWTQDWFGNI